MAKKRKVVKKEKLSDSNITQLKELLENQKNDKIEEQSKRYVDKLEEHKKASIDNSKYSIRRFDIAIVSLASGGLASCLALIKLIIEKSIDPILIKFSFALFGITLILNLVSQITSYYSNRYESIVAKNVIRKERGYKEIGNHESFLKWSNNLSKATNLLNLTCLLLFITGLIFMIVFIFKI